MLPFFEDICVLGTISSSRNSEDNHCTWWLSCEADAIVDVRQDWLGN